MGNPGNQAESAEIQSHGKLLHSLTVGKSEVLADLLRKRLKVCECGHWDEFNLLFYLQLISPLVPKPNQLKWEFRILNLLCN